MQRVESTVFLIIAKVMIRFVPYRYWHHVLDVSASPHKTPLPDAQRQYIRTNVEAAARQLPGGQARFACLPQAITASWMLRRRGYPFELHIGIQRAPQTTILKIQSHAWVLSGGQFVAGEPRPTSSFQSIVQFGHSSS